MCVFSNRHRDGSFDRWILTKKMRRRDVKFALIERFDSMFYHHRVLILFWECKSILNKYFLCLLRAHNLLKCI